MTKLILKLICIRLELVAYSGIGPVLTFFENPIEALESMDPVVEPLSSVRRVRP